MSLAPQVHAPGSTSSRITQHIDRFRGSSGICSAAAAVSLSFCTRTARCSLGNAPLGILTRMLGMVSFSVCESELVLQPRLMQTHSVCFDIFRAFSANE